MSARRWQIVGGLVFSIILVVVWNLAIATGQLPATWWTWGGGVVAAIVGHPVGRAIVREWQAAGPDHGRRYDDR